MHFRLLLIAMLATPFIIAQNSVVLDAGLEAKVPIENLKYSVCYDKFGDGFSRLEDTKLQYYNADFQKVWEKELEKVDGIGKYNWFVTGNNGENMILAQYGTAYKVDNIDARLIRVNKKGDMVSIDLGSLLNFRAVAGYEFFEDGFMMNAIEAKGTVTPYGNTLKYYTHVLYFDYDLKPMKKNITLPAFTEDESHNYMWVYNRRNGDDYEFQSVYFLKDGKPSESGKPESQGKRTIVMNKDGVIISDVSVSLSLPSSAGTYSSVFSAKKFDQRYKVLLDNYELEAMRFFKLTTNFESIVVEKDGNRSGNLVTEFYQLVDPKILTKKNTIPTLQITDVVEDKINDGPVLIAHSTTLYKYYIIVLSNDLKIASVVSYSSYDVTVPYKFSERELMFYCGEKDLVYGQLPVGYKPNLFTKISECGKECLHTILNYDGYQMLITEDFNLKTTTVTKFSY